MSGVRFPSILLSFAYFDMVWGMPVDYMHCICLGVAKKLSALWFDKKFSSFPWSLSKHLDHVDKLLKEVRPPRGVKGLPRSLKERHHWKGTVIFFLSFLQLQQQADECSSGFMSFSSSSFVAAEYKVWLLYLARGSGGPSSSTALHSLPAFGLFPPCPPWTISCFPFESANGLLVRCITGTTNSILNMIVSAMCLQNVRLITSSVNYAVVLCISKNSSPGRSSTQGMEKKNLFLIFVYLFFSFFFPFFNTFFLFCYFLFTLSSFHALQASNSHLRSCAGAGSL